MDSRANLKAWRRLQLQLLSYLTQQHLQALFRRETLRVLQEPLPRSLDKLVIEISVSLGCCIPTILHEHLSINANKSLNIIRMGLVFEHSPMNCQSAQSTRL